MKWKIFVGIGLIGIVVLVAVIVFNNRCDYNNPNRHYVAKSPTECAVIDYECGPNMKYFSNECGCGCELDPNFNISLFIEKVFGQYCSQPVFCNRLVKLNCSLSKDIAGEFEHIIYYLNATTARGISICGDYCNLTEEKLRTTPGIKEKCETLCPPLDWNCN